MKGLFITFEGGEGAGKTTLIDQIFSHLQQRSLKVMKTRAPGGTKAGESIRELVLHHKNISLLPRTELLLFLADRAQHVDEVIRPALNEGTIVLCDRFNDSTVAYQGGARGIDLATVKELCNFATGNLQPNLTLYLDLDPKLGLERVNKLGTGKDRIELEKLSFHDKIRNAFHAIAKEEPKRFHLVDASRPPEEVFLKAMHIIHAYLGNP